MTVITDLPIELIWYILNYVGSYRMFFELSCKDFLILSKREPCITNNQQKRVNYIRNIIMNNYLNLLKYVVTYYHMHPNITTIAAKYGQLNILKWARENDCEWNSLTCIYAAENGHLETLKWARENGCEWNKRNCLYGAKKYPNVINWIESQKD